MAAEKARDRWAWRNSGAWANQVRRDFAGAASAVGFFERFEEKNINVCSWFEIEYAYRFLRPWDEAFHVRFVR